MTFLPGDIVGVRGNLLIRTLNLLVSPYSDRGHFLLLGEYADGDWTIYESLFSKGLRVGKLSQYKGKDIEVGRVDKEVGALVIRDIARYGHIRYDFLSFFRLVWTGVKYRVKHGKPISYAMLSDWPNKSFLCTELITEAYRDYCQFVPGNVAATPAAIMQAYSKGLIEMIWRGVLANNNGMEVANA